MPQFKTIHISFAPPATVATLRVFVDQWKDSPQLSALREVVEVAAPWFQCNMQFYRGSKCPTLVLQGLAAILLQEAIAAGTIQFPFQIVGIRTRTYYHRIDPGPWTYRITRYHPFGPNETKVYLRLQTPSQWLVVLQKTLRDYIEAYCFMVDLPVTQTVQLAEVKMERQFVIRKQNRPFYYFDLTFWSNVYLPDHINLGSGTAEGYGCIRRVIAGPSNHAVAV